MTELLNRFRGEDGQGLVEYALIIALVSVALIAALSLMTGGIGDLFADVSSALTNALP